MKKCLFSNRIYKNSIETEFISEIQETITVFNKAVHYAHELYTDTENRGIRYDDSVHVMTKHKFSLTSTPYVNSIEQSAKAMFNNAVENHSNYIENFKYRIQRIEGKISKTETALKNKESVLKSLIDIHKASLAGRKLPKFKTYKGAREFLSDKDTLTFGVKHKNKVDYYNIYTFEVCYLKPCIKSLKSRLKHLKDRLNRTSQQLSYEELRKPTACFGSRKLFKKQHISYKSNHIAWKQEFDYRRNKSFMVSGRHDAYQGNFIFRYEPVSQKLSFETILGRPIELKNVHFLYGQELLEEALSKPAKERKPVAWMIENFKDYYIIKVMIDIKPSANVNYSLSDGVISSDTNVDHFAMTDLDAKGNILDTKVIRFDLSGKSSLQAKQILANIAKEAMAWCREKKKPFAMENLDLEDSKRKLLYNGRRLNEKLSSFAYAKVTESLLSRALKDEIAVFKVNPAFTSQIGKIKYAKALGLSVHMAAAMVIGRRALGLKDTVPKQYLKFLSDKQLQRHHWSHWRYVSSQLKSVEPKYFYQAINFNKFDTLSKTKNYLVSQGN